MDKSPDAFRTISEVADWLGVPTHVLRFWESRFTQVKPVKRAGGRRYYRPVDMLLLGGIKRLLHDEGLTIRGVQKMLREEGVRHVSSFSQPIDTLEPMRDVTDYDDDGDATPMAVDVEQEAADNVVPLMPAASETAPEPLVLRDQVRPEAPPAEAEADLPGQPAEADPVAEATREAGQEEDTAAEEAQAEHAAADEAVADDFAVVEELTTDAATEDGAVDAAPGDEAPVEVDAAAAVPAEEGGLSDDAARADAEPLPPSAPAGDAEPIPVFSFLRRRSRDGTPMPIQPDLFGTPEPEPAPAPEPEPEPEAVAAPTVIPPTPDVPDVDTDDDDPETPARPGIAARLATARLRVDPATIAGIVADLRDLRARL